MESSKSKATKARAICNPVSGGFDSGSIPTEKPGDTEDAVRPFAGGILIGAAAVNGLGKAGFPSGVTLAILPTGTDSDPAAAPAIPNALRIVVGGNYVAEPER